MTLPCCRGKLSAISSYSFWIIFTQIACHRLTILTIDVNRPWTNLTKQQKHSILYFVTFVFLLFVPRRAIRNHPLRKKRKKQSQQKKRRLIHGIFPRSIRYKLPPLEFMKESQPTQCGHSYAVPPRGWRGRPSTPVRQTGTSLHYKHRGNDHCTAVSPPWPIA